MGAAITNTLEVAGVVADAFGNPDAAAAAREKNAAAATDRLARADRLGAEADWAEADARLEQMELALAGRRNVAEIRVGFAASGVRADSGSAAEAAGDAAAWGEYERSRAAASAELTSWTLRTDAAALRRAGSIGNGGGNKFRSLLGTGSAFFATGAGKIIVNPESAFS